MKREKIKTIIIGLLCFLSLNTIFAQFTIPPKPKVSEQKGIYDYANLLKVGQKNALGHKLVSYADSTSTQMVVVVVPSLLGEDKAQLAVRWAHKWGIGQKKEDNGLIILLAIKERQMYIAPGYGLESILTAGVNGEIIRNVFLPEFKKSNYYQGLDKGTDALIDLFAGKYKAAKKTNNSEPPILVFFLIIGVVVLLIISSKAKGGGKGNGKFSQPSLLDIIVLSSLGRGSNGGFGSGSSSGGFGGGFSGGFGGGGFSGGGSGGSW